MWPKLVVLTVVLSTCCARVFARQQKQLSPPPLIPVEAVHLLPCWIFQPHPLPLPPGSPRSGSGSTGGIYAVGGEVSAPRPIFTPDPEFTEEARKARFHGTVGLATIVGPNGIPLDIRVARRVGMGLDDKAVEAVKHWIFAPGQRNGRAVPVQMRIEVRFDLQNRQTDCTF